MKGEGTGMRVKPDDCYTSTAYAPSLCFRLPLFFNGRSEPHRLAAGSGLPRVGSWSVMETRHSSESARMSGVYIA